MQKLIAIALATLFAAAAHSESKASDDHDITRAGCRVRTTNVDARGIATVAADCHWQRTPDAVLGIMRDPPRLADALSSLGECKKFPGGRVLQVHSVGWPLDDRQITLDWRESALPDGGVRFDYKRAAKQEPLGEGRVQILKDEGFWEITADGKGGTNLSYTSRYDAGGNLKPWVVRRFQKDGIATSLEELLAAVPQR